VCSSDEELAERYFGSRESERRGEFKTAQLCKQVERAVAWALSTECEAALLSGAVVAEVSPAPDASRLRITVVLGPERTAAELGQAWTELSRATPAFRAEVARAISRKRVPDLAWDVRLSDGGVR
jgi:ribosome-binding factor A